MKFIRRYFCFILCHFFLLFNVLACASKTDTAPGSSIPLGSPIRGDVNAPVKIIEFTDFECHFCGQVQPALLKALQTYPTQVSLVFKNFPLSMHRHAHMAHMAAMCANEQDKFWEYRNILFKNQGALKHVDLVGYAAQLNLNVETFTKCLDEEKYASKIEEDFHEGIHKGVQGTPTFFINGKSFSGAQPYAAFEQSIKQALAEHS